VPSGDFFFSLYGEVDLLDQPLECQDTQLTYCFSIA